MIKSNIKKIINKIQDIFFPINKFKNCNIYSPTQSKLNFKYNQENSNLLIDSSLNCFLTTAFFVLFLIYTDKYFSFSLTVPTVYISMVSGILTAISFVLGFCNLVGLIFLKKD